jgi:hypothetical protein
MQTAANAGADVAGRANDRDRAWRRDIAADLLDQRSGGQGVAGSECEPSVSGDQAIVVTRVGSIEMVKVALQYSSAQAR